MKYNETKTKAELASIMAAKPQKMPYKQEELREAVLANLPKSTICPKHNCQMSVFSGISKKGEPYRVYKCGISGCKEILWTDREAETINAEVKDIEAMLGIEKLPATPAEGLEKKQRFIEKSIDQKQNSIKDFAIKRDATMFAASGMNADDLIRDHKFWLDYFREIYK